MDILDFKTISVFQVAADNANAGEIHLAMGRLLELGWHVGFHPLSSSDMGRISCILCHENFNDVCIGEGPNMYESLADALLSKIGA